ncbi:VOC family protein [Staphylococcus xylosus]|jgi:predicted 3-demethylubiquinone-9 3-methyltransferase (glyoxalase superfamily)|nr:VOC family protein [Staphylococcus xylosus]MCD8784843.1 VOC family protein [Staphylococcus xylosus]MEB6204347.1 VOC family protein [Staphylococcus xylosus]MEB6241384.1 VOC family protein [Staphylococcus xylosus]MEB7719050.1 VOC family protein [Staphylococcus xylosus]MEB7800751.1 VOC family protein [Staphylococcus xylosus]
MEDEVMTHQKIVPHLWFDTEAEKAFTTIDVKVLFKK